MSDPVSSTGRSGRPRIVVVGGGLAGLKAALSCAEAGAAVTLLEARPRLGGATWSFARRGLMFDNGQHVHLRCCEAYRSLLERLGTEALAPFDGSLAIPVLRPCRPSATRADRATVSWIRRDDLVAPAHLARALATYRHLGLADRMRLLPAAVGLRFARLEDPRLDTETFGSWLARHGQRPEAIERLWDLITLPTTNLRAFEVSLALAAKVFKTGLLTDKAAADLAWSRVPLAELHVEPARRLLESLGTEIHLRAKVSELVLGGAGPTEPPRVRGVVADGQILEAEAVILAVPHEVAAGLLPEAAHPAPGSLVELGSVPIVNVHLVFDRKVMPYAVAAAVDSPVQFVFDRTAAAGLDPSQPGQVVAISLSGADGEIGTRPEQLIEEQLEAFRVLFPSARSAEVVDAVVSREHDATFRGLPGTRPLRARPETGISNLALAGAWTDTGWPATMEGAVRSGAAAADVVLRAIGHRGHTSNRHEEVVA